MNLYELQNEVTDWADSVSPNRLPKDAVVKMVSETSELLDAVLNKDPNAVDSELGDCLILLLDIASMYDIDIVHAGKRKMLINRKRQWTVEGGVIRRDRGNSHDTT